MTDNVEFPVTSRELRSLVTEDGLLSLSLERVEISEPGAGELVVRVEGAPVNPSDVNLMLVGIPASDFAEQGEGAGRRMVAPIPPAILPRLEHRVGKSMPVGLEAMGTVVAAGPDLDRFLGKKVAMVGDGNFAEFRKVTPEACLILPDDTEPEAGAAAYINPLTSYSMVETMRAEGHTALVHAPAASNLGQMLVKLCQADGIGLVNVVRSEEQVQLLKGLGAEFVLNSNSSSFAEDLAAAVRATGATLAFDAVSGGELASQILTAMEKGNQAEGVAHNRFASDVNKQVYIYSNLDPSPIVIRKEFGLPWAIAGWVLFPVLRKLGTDVVDRMKARILDELDTTFASNFSRSMTVDQFLEPETLQMAASRTTGGKILLRPWSLAPDFPM